MQRKPQSPETSAMAAAFLAALKRRVSDRPTGEITLPTGPAAADEIDRVLQAPDRARQAEGH